MYVRPKTENNLKKVIAIKVIKNNPLFQCEKNLHGMEKAQKCLQFADWLVVISEDHRLAIIELNVFYPVDP